MSLQITVSERDYQRVSESVYKYKEIILFAHLIISTFLLLRVCRTLARNYVIVAQLKIELSDAQGSNIRSRDQDTVLREAETFLLCPTFG